MTAIIKIIGQSVNYSIRTINPTLLSAFENN